MRSPSVSAGLTGALFRYLLTRGLAPEAILAGAGLDQSLWADLDARVPLSAYRALLDSGKAMTGDGALAAQFAAEIDMSEFSVVGLLAHASATMAEALIQLNRYGQLVVDVDLGEDRRFATIADTSGVWLVDTRRDPNAFPDLTESTLTRMTVAPRQFLPRPHVLEVHMTHPRPAHARVLEELLQVPVTFSARWNAMRMDPSSQTEPVALQPRFVFGILAERADGLLTQLNSGTSQRAAVERVILPILHTGTVNADDVATSLGMSRQTLYRKLKAEGVSFAQVLDDLRHRMALDYLGARKVSVNETAYLLGFSESAAFSRAFKRWTGKSPRHARLQ